MFSQKFIANFVLKLRKEMKNKKEIIWENCLGRIRNNLQEVQYNSWFSPITAEAYDEATNTLTLRVPSEYYVEQLEGTYSQLLGWALATELGKGFKLRYSLDKIKGDPGTRVIEEPPHKSDKLREIPLPADPFAEREYPDFDPQLNPIYTFENYCESKSNQLAYTIASAIAENPKCQTFNPMFVFGPTGVGKTHLIQAVGIRMKEENPHSRVLYLSARTFESQYTTAVRKNTVNDFISFYQSIDMLIIDDVQEFAGKTGTQNTFFHIFNYLHNKQKHLILSCDCPPSELDGMEPRLLSRFKWGMTVELYRPDYELRKAVFLRKVSQAGVEVPMEIADYIATNVTDNVRELEGVFTSLMAHATALNQPLTVELARTVLSNSVRLTKRQVTFDTIVDAVCSQFSIDTDTLFSKSRKRDVADSRQLVMALAKKFTKMSSTTIGMKLKRNHATVLHACKAIEERLSVDKDFRSLVQKVEQELVA